MANALIVRPLPFAGISASDSASGFVAANMANDHMGVVWRSNTGATARSITIDLGSDQPIDFVALLGCTGATADWTLTVEAATAAQGTGFPGGSFNSGVLPFLAGAAFWASGRGIGWWHGAPVTARHVRLTIGGLDGDAATVARVVLGKDLGLERNFSFGAAFGMLDLGSADFSARAVLIRRRAPRLPVLAISYANAHKDEVERAISPLLDKVGKTDPVFICTDPEPDELRQRRCYFGTLTGDLGTTWRTARGFEWRVNLTSMLR